MVRVFPLRSKDEEAADALGADVRGNARTEHEGLGPGPGLERSGGGRLGVGVEVATLVVKRLHLREEGPIDLPALEPAKAVGQDIRTTVLAHAIRCPPGRSRES